MCMGVWGVELYQNDTTLDVKNRFEQLLCDGNTVEQVTIRLINEFKSLMGDLQEEPLFWLALADTQWEKDLLLPLVKNKALYWIDQGIIMDQVQMGDILTKEQQKKMLDELQRKLLSPPPLIKKPKKKIYCPCDWNIGDVFAYPLESELAKERGFLGRFFLIQKIDEYEVDGTCTFPIIYVKITENEKLPLNLEEYDRLEYVQTWFSKYEERFFPIDVRRWEEDIAEKSKLHYEVDEFGFLPQFRAILMSTSKNNMQADLTYLGNFKEATSPKREFIPHSKHNIITVPWKRSQETFESKILRRYLAHNLRELDIYHKTGDGSLSRNQNTDDVSPFQTESDN